MLTLTSVFSKLFSLLLQDSKGQVSAIKGQIIAKFCLINWSKIKYQTNN